MPSYQNKKYLRIDFEAVIQNFRYSVKNYKPAYLWILALPTDGLAGPLQ